MAKEPFVEKLTSLWTGALFFWICSGFKDKYSDLLNPKFEKRNMWTGYIINIIAAGLVIYWFGCGRWW